MVATFSTTAIIHFESSHLFSHRATRLSITEAIFIAFSFVVSHRSNLNGLGCVSVDESNDRFVPRRSGPNPDISMLHIDGMCVYIHQ